MSEDIVVQAAQFKDLLSIFIVLAHLPKDVNPSYQGKIRELLKPFLESMSEFSMKTFVDKLEEYEDSKNLFADKVKTRAQANLGRGSTASNHPTGQFGQAGYDKRTRPSPNPATIKKLKDSVND